MIELSETLKKALIDLYNSQKASSSTLPPGSYGVGGQSVTGWVRVERVDGLFEVLEQEQWFRDHYTK